MARKPKAKTNGHPVLAKPGDPLLTSDGRQIEPETREDETARPTKLNPKTFRPTKKRSINDLPAPINVINGIACVFMYTLLGLGDREIVDALKITSAELKQLRTHSAYTECFSTVLGEFVNANSDLLASRIAAFSHVALDTVANLAEHGKKEEVKLTASRDLLDRAGVTAKENKERGTQQADTLRIIVVKATDETTDVNIKIGA